MTNAVYHLKYLNHLSAQKIKVTNTSKFWIHALLPFGDDTLAQWEHSEYGSRSSWQNSHAITSEFNWPFERLMSTEPVPFVVRGPYPPRPAQQISVPDERSLLTCQPRKDGWSARKWAKKNESASPSSSIFPLSFAKVPLCPSSSQEPERESKYIKLISIVKRVCPSSHLGQSCPNPLANTENPLCVCVCARSKSCQLSELWLTVLSVFFFVILPPNFGVGDVNPFLAHPKSLIPPHNR